MIITPLLLLSLILYVIILPLPLIHASFIAPNLQASLPFRAAMATAVRNNTMLLFGGKGSGPPYLNDLYELTQHEKTYTWRRIPHANQAPPGVMYSRAIYDDRTDALLVFGGSVMVTTSGRNPLQVYRYDFGTNHWETLMNSTIDLKGQPWPDNRFHFDMAYDPSQHIAYLAGGHISGNGSYVASDMWSVAIDGRNLSFKRLPDMPAARHGHTMSFININDSSVESPQAVVFIGGLIQDNGKDPQLASMNTLDLYDTTQNKWITKNISSGSSPGRINHVAAIDDSQKIYIFGGDNGATAEYDMMYFDDLRILDPTSWQWDAPSPQGVPPGRRSYASAAILDGQYMTIAFGSTLNVWYNDINVFSTEDQNWHQSFNPDDDTYADNNSGLPPGSIAGIVIGAVVGVILLLALFFLRRILWDIVQNIVWRQRHGEPRWTEVSRIASLTFMVILFFVLLGFMLRQVFTSPTVMQRYSEPSNFVDVPDIRFCFDGFPSTGNQAPGDPRLACQTDMGYDCNTDVISLNLTYFQPASSTGFSTCFLYRPSLDFKLSPRTVGNKGSRLVFTIFANGSYASSGRVHISAYPRIRDPNVRLYNLTGVTKMNKAEIADWITNEQYNIQTANTYIMELLTYNGMSFNVVNRQSLVPDAWSYFGVLPHINHQRIVETTFQQNPPDSGYTSSHSDIGYLNVIPMEYARVRDREVRVYTLLNVVGFVGGVASLLFTIHSWLWGTRPSSPWGVVQRYASGPVQRSLRNNLRAHFFDLAPSGSNLQQQTMQVISTPYNNIPFVNEDAAFSYNKSYDSDIKDDNESRMMFMEDRLRLLERVVKSYYFDTELFQQLNVAVNPTTTSRSNIKATTSSSSRFFRLPGINRRQRRQDEEQQRNEQHVLTAVPSSSSDEEEHDSNKDHHSHVE